MRTAVKYHFWGTWLTTPHAGLGDVIGWQPFVTESATRLVGWLFDQEHGLLPYAPIYLLVPAGWLALWKRDRDSVRRAHARRGRLRRGDDDPAAERARMARRVDAGGAVSRAGRPVPGHPGVRGRCASPRLPTWSCW